MLFCFFVAVPANAKARCKQPILRKEQSGAFASTKWNAHFQGVPFPKKRGACMYVCVCVCVCVFVPVHSPGFPRVLVPEGGLGKPKGFFPGILCGIFFLCGVCVCVCICVCVSVCVCFLRIPLLQLVSREPTGKPQFPDN